MAVGSNHVTKSDMKIYNTEDGMCDLALRSNCYKSSGERVQAVIYIRIRFGGRNIDFPWEVDKLIILGRSTVTDHAIT
jgi:hypothetical protein